MTRCLRSLLPAGLLAAMALGPLGCTPQAGPGEKISCFRATPKALANVHRVVFVELDDGGQYPQIAARATQEIAQALSRQGRFHVDVLRRSDPRCEDLDLGRPRRFTMDDFARMRQRLQADAVLTGQVTGFHPYPRMQAGLYLSLVDVRAGKMVWGVDHYWDTAQTATAGRLREYFRTEMRDDYGPAEWEMALMSPRAFLKFVAHEAASTLESSGQATGNPVAKR